MLSKKYRLNRKQINLIYKKGKGENLGILGIKFLKNRVGHPRFAVVVPQKTVKKAVERNRWRRVIFDELYQMLKENLKEKSTDFIIRLYSAEVSEKDLRQKIREVMQ